MSSTRRDLLVDTALDLFCRNGFHATGIDKILAESGVAKMTLYNHFKSKDELILAALRRRDERFRNWFMRTVEQRVADPRQRLLTLFDVLEEWFGSSEYTGCVFINASAEYAGPDNPIHATSAEHKRLMLGYIQELAAAAGATDAEALAYELMLLVEGAMVMAQMTCNARPAKRARAAAEKLVQCALG